MRWPAPATVRYGIIVVLLVLWEILPRSGLVAQLFLPPLSKTLMALAEDRWIYAEALLVTLYEVACAMLISCGAGLLIGSVVGAFAPIREVMGQFQECFVTMARMFTAMQQEQSALMCEQMRLLQDLTRELRELRSDVKQGGSGAAAAPVLTRSLHVVQLTQQRQTFSLPSGVEPSNVELDPDAWTMMQATFVKK